MKGLILGTDLLEYGDTVKTIEINTNTGILNRVVELLDVNPFFNMLIENNINELHFIFTQNYGGDVIEVKQHNEFTTLLQQKSDEYNITFFMYPLKNNSITIPYIEDREDIFILRQSYDSTAIIDDVYCADKFGFAELMEGSEFEIKTYTPTVNNFNSLNTTIGYPNAVVKSRYPIYDSDILPELYVLSNINELNELKNTLEPNLLIQEFIYDEKNIIDNRYSAIRSLDILFGDNLDIINIGCYKTTTILDLDFYPNEFIENTNKFNKKTRYKFINKKLGKEISGYHVDSDSLILKSDGSLVDIDDILIGDLLQSIDFTDKNNVSPSNSDDFYQALFINGWDSTVQHDNTTLTELDSEVEQKISKFFNSLFIRITLSNGETWTDSPSAKYYIEEKDSNNTNWEVVNNLYIGDKLVVRNSMGTLSTIEITNLEIEFDSKTIHTIDIEPSDLFLVDVGKNLLGIMHNSCWCCAGGFPPWNCGSFCCRNFCAQCDSGTGKTIY